MNEIDTKRILNEIEVLCTKVKGWNSSNLSKYDKLSIINDAYMKIHKHFISGKISYENYEDYKGYLWLTTRNTVLRYYKYRDTHYSWVRMDYIEETGADKPIPTINEQTYDVKLIYNLIDNLKNEQGKAIRLYIQGYNVKESAKILNLTEKEVKSKLTSGKRKLKELLRN